MNRTPAGATFNLLVYVVFITTFFMVLLNKDTLADKCVPLGALLAFLAVYPFTLSKLFK